MGLHVDVAIPARDRQHLERLCRYVARPRVAAENPIPLRFLFGIGFPPQRELIRLDPDMQCVLQLASQRVLRADGLQESNHRGRLP